MQNIKGIRNWSLNNVPYIEDIIKIALYADDITLFLNDENDMRHALNVIHELSIFSGLEVNRTKSHAMWLGNGSKGKAKDSGNVFLQLQMCVSY